MSNMALMCRCVEITLWGCVEQNIVQNAPSLTRFLPICIWCQRAILGTLINFIIWAWPWPYVGPFKEINVKNLISRQFLLWKLKNFFGQMKSRSRAMTIQMCHTQGPCSSPSGQAQRWYIFHLASLSPPVWIWRQKYIFHLPHFAPVWIWRHKFWDKI